MSTPKNITLGIRGMAAGLRMTVDDFITAYKNKEIPPPETVYAREARWSIESFGKEVLKRVIKDEDDSLKRLLLGMEALDRAERAEGWHDE